MCALTYYNRVGVVMDCPHQVIDAGLKSVHLEQKAVALLIIVVFFKETRRAGALWVEVEPLLDGLIQDDVVTRKVCFLKLLQQGGLATADVSF